VGRKRDGENNQKNLLTDWLIKISVGNARGLKRSGREIKMIQISNSAIVRQIERSGSVNGAAKALGLSWETVRRAQSGKRAEPVRAWGSVKVGELCSCCGREERAPGNRWLCRECWETAECGEVYPETAAVGVGGRLEI
jgi:hypothetical protein